MIDDGLLEIGKQHEQHEDLALKLEEVLSFTCPTLLSDICIYCYLECCISISILSYMHHASSCVSKKKISKFIKFLQKAKLSVLIDYSLTVIDCTSCFKLIELCLVSI